MINEMTQPIDKIINSKPKQLTPSQAAELIGVAWQTLALRICTKKENIPYYKVGGKVYYRETDLLVWLESKRVAA